MRRSLLGPFQHNNLFYDEPNAHFWHKYLNGEEPVFAQVNFATPRYPDYRTISIICLPSVRVLSAF